jgi:hypothetical protein
MRRFWVTARICRPKRVRFRPRAAGGEDHQREDDDPQPVVGDRHLADLEGTGHPAGLPTSRLVGPKMVRTACCRISDTPQVASRVSSGRPYRESG